jgi:hypothetical protein
MSVAKKRPRAEQEEAAAEQRRLAPVLREAHARLRLWRLCEDQTCRRSKSCGGDADQCGARVAAQGWAWLNHVIKAMREGKAQEAAIEAANQAVLGYRQRCVVRWPHVKCWDDIEFVQLADGSWEKASKVPLRPEHRSAIHGVGGLALAAQRGAARGCHEGSRREARRRWSGIVSRATNAVGIIVPSPTRTRACPSSGVSRVGRSRMNPTSAAGEGCALLPRAMMGEGYLSRQPLTLSSLWAHHCALSRKGRGHERRQRCRGAKDQPAGVRNNRHCFRIVINNGFCNSRVSVALSAQTAFTAMWSNGPCGTPCCGLGWLTDLQLPCRLTAQS